MNDKVKTTETKEVVKKETNQALALSESDMMSDANTGLENVTSEDLAIPFIRITQAMSPQVNARDGKYIKDCEQGDIFNTVDNTLYKGAKGVTVVPVAYKRTYLEWMPERKGLAAVHDSSEILKEVSKSDKGQDYLPNGNLLSTTANHYVLVLDENGGFNQAILAFGGSQLKKSKKWNSIMSGLKIRTKDGNVFTPPTFSHKYVLTSVVEQNDQGSWYGWDIALSDQLSADDGYIYSAAKQFSLNVNSGVVKSTQQEDAPF
ncbi:MAG: hypothetical protein CL867_11400 [Cytophagaceae bacterium]|nr:hypothetical protein [Cytophagaceae bacterium]